MPDAMKASLLDEPEKARKWDRFPVGLVSCLACLAYAGFHCYSKETFILSLVSTPQSIAPLFRIVADSPFDAGEKHGRIAKHRIISWFQSKEMQDLFRWCADASKGKAAFEELKLKNSRAFPTYVEEMLGIAYGAGVDPDKVWAANLIMELEILMTNSKKQEEHCSDEFVVSEKGYKYGFAHGHNDDWSPEARKWFYYLSVEPSNNDAQSSGVESCAGLAYPATLVGWAPTWNAHGLYLTQNTLTPRATTPNGLACVFVQKNALCNSRSLDEVVGKLTLRSFNGSERAQWSDGASINLVDLKNQRMANVETWENQVDVLEITPSMGNYTHFNEYKHLLKPNGHTVDNTSMFVKDLRQKRVDSLPAPVSDRDIMARPGDPQVYSAKGTLTTLVLNGTTGDLNVWCCGTSSASGNPPVHHWNLFNFFVEQH